MSDLQSGLNECESDVPGRVTDDELEHRIRALQHLLLKHDLKAVICFGAHPDYQPADLRYLARWSCVDDETSYVYVPAAGGSTLVTDAEWDVERAQEEAYANCVLYDPEPGRALAGLVAEHSDAGDRIGISGFAAFPASVYVTLTELCREIIFEDVTHLIEGLRLVKSDAEIALLREAASVSDMGMQAGLARMQPGCSEAEVAAEAEYAIRSTGAELSFMTMMGAGVRTSHATFLPTDRKMQQGEFAILDCGARVAGYHGDMCRTVVMGEPTDKQRRLLESVEAAVACAVTQAAPGRTVEDIHFAARGAIDEAGFSDHWWGHFMPHGTGTAQHESPFGLDSRCLELQSGMVLCIEPGLAVPGIGAIILEQMIAITDDGAEVLNALPLNLWDGYGEE